MLTNRRPPATATGVADDVVVPSPNCPYQLRPQHHAAPVDVSRPQLWWVAVLIALKVRPPGTGSGDSAMLSPGAGWFRKRFPQHHAAPAASSAQVWIDAAEMATND